MEESCTQNAIIKSADIDYGRDLWLNPVITFQGDGWTQSGFGQFVFCIIDTDDEFSVGKRIVGPHFGTFINRVLDTVEVERWSQLPNTPCRVAHSDLNIYGIGHIYKDKWFYPDKAWFNKINDRWDSHRSEVRGT